jgi:hypothetical protein
MASGGSRVRRLVLVAAIASTLLWSTLVWSALGSESPALQQELVVRSPEASSPAVVGPQAGRRDLFWTSAHTLRHQSRLSGGSWSRPLARGGGLASQPSVVSWGQGRLDVFARGLDNRLMWRTWRSGAGRRGGPCAVR